MLIHVTDLHFNRAAFDAVAALTMRTAADLCISGDLLDCRFEQGSTPISEQEAWVKAWIEKQTFKIFVCTGNHDGDTMETPYAAWLLRLGDKKRVFVDGQTGLSSCGTRITCVSYMSAPFDEKTQFAMGAAKVILTHIGPTKSRVSRFQQGKDGGDSEVREFLESGQATPGSLILCGHVHLPSANIEVVEGVAVLNPGAAGEGSSPIAIITEPSLEIRLTTLAAEGCPLSGPPAIC